MRLFIAIDLPKETEDIIRASFLYAKDVLEFAQFTAPENLHITLAFLGEAPDSSVDEIKSVIKIVSSKYPDRDLTINNVIIGPDEGRARMIWLKLDSGSQKYLEDIAGDLKSKLTASGIDFDNTYEKLNGHITLAKFGRKWNDDFQSKTPKDKASELAKIKESLPENFSAKFSSKGIVLFSSYEDGGERVYMPLFESNFKE